MVTESEVGHKVVAVIEITPLQALTLGATTANKVDGALDIPETIPDHEIANWMTDKTRDFVLACSTESAFRNIVGGAISVTQDADGIWTLQVDKLSSQIETFTDIAAFDKKSKEVENNSDKSLLLVYIDDTYFQEVLIPELEKGDIDESILNGTEDAKKEFIIKAIDTVRKRGGLADISIQFHSSDAPDVNANKMLRKYAQKVKNSRGRQ